MHELQRRTALACRLCDPGGEAPFQRREHLLSHMQEVHNQRLCSLCLQVGANRWLGGRVWGTLADAGGSLRSLLGTRRRQRGEHGSARQVAGAGCAAWLDFLR